MKLIAIIKKEIMAVKSQKISILFILLYPILGTILLGLAMNGGGFDSSSTLSIGITGNDLNLISDLLTDSKYNFINYQDDSDLITAVQKKQVTVGLEFIKSDEIQSIVNIYYDNSNLISSNIFTSLIKTNIENISKEQTLFMLSGILKTTNLFSTNITDELDKLSEFKKNLQTVDFMLDGLETKLNSFDINDLRLSINEQKQNIVTFKEKNKKLKEMLILTRTEFNNLSYLINQINSNFSQYSYEINKLKSEIPLQKSNLQYVINQLGSFYYLVPDSIKNDYAQQISQLSNLSNYLVQWENSINNLDNLSNVIITLQSNMNSSVNEFNTMLTSLEKDSADIDLALSSSEQGVAKLESNISLFEETIAQGKQLISENRLSKISIESKINQSEELFNELLPKLNSFKDINPELLIQPIKINLVPTQINSKLVWSLVDIDATQLGVMVSNAMSVILILTCILLSGIVILSEKNQEIPLRLFMSETSSITLMIGKLIGQLIIALVEAIMIILVAIIVFGFPLSINYAGLLFSIILIGSAFISIGMVIGAYTKNQSTTILLSLLLIIPMLFLSGIIVPLELMPSAVSALAEILPLTAANNLLIGVIVKSGDIYFIWREIIVLCTITFVGMILVLLKKQ